MAEQGYNILINYKSNETEAQKTLDLVREKKVAGEVLKFDVSNKADVDQILGAWIESHKEDVIEILVNDAGIRQDALMIWMTDEQWKNVLGSSLDGFYYVTRLVINGMLTKRYGRIVNIVSLSGQKGMPGQTNYSAAKAGVIGATKALAQEVARRNVTVNAVAPGFIETDMTAILGTDFMGELIQRTPVRRVGQPQDIANAYLFLASEKASFITGTCINVDGGLTL